MAPTSHFNELAASFAVLADVLSFRTFIDSSNFFIDLIALLTGSFSNILITFKNSSNNSIFLDYIYVKNA